MAAASFYPKARSNSDDCNSSARSPRLNFDHSFQRAASSEAQLPSHHDRDYRHCTSSLSISSSQDSLDGTSDDNSNNIAAPSRNCPVAPDVSTAVPSTTQHVSHQPRRSYDDMAKSQQRFSSERSRQFPFFRSVSDGACDSGAERLQTIESGISPADSAAAQGLYSPGQGSRYNSIVVQYRSPQCPSHHPVNYQDIGSRDSLPRPQQQSSQHQHHAPDAIDATSPSGAVGSSLLMPPLHPGSSHGHYGSLPPLLPQLLDELGHPTRARLPSDHSHYSIDAGKHGFLSHNRNVHHVDDSDVGSVDANSASDSLVLKYSPGQETPPAEYALPASILGVYGVDCECCRSHGTLLTWTHTESEGSANGSIALDVESRGGLVDGDEGTFQGSPSGSRSLPQVPHLPARSSDDDAMSPGRILPYHERKRLMELEEKGRKKKDGRESVKTRQQSRLTALAARDEKDGSDGRDGCKEDETTPLTGRRRSDAYGTGGDRTRPTAAGWLGRLLSVVAGKSNDGNGRIQGEATAQSFLDRGQAFLRETEEERKRMQELSRIDELNNVTVPVMLWQSFDRANTSFRTNALYSIASRSDEGDDEASDEETGLSSYPTDDEDGTSKSGEDSEEAPTARVWTYGEPPISPTVSQGTSPRSKASTKRKAAASRRHDISIMEHVLQNEYKYQRLHSKHFRLFVMVTVVAISGGALAFVLVVCVRMLLSIR